MTYPFTRHLVVALFSLCSSCHRPTACFQPLILSLIGALGVILGFFGQ